MRSSSHLSLCTPFGVSIYHRSMSNSCFPGSVLQDVASNITVVDKVVDAAHQFVDKVGFPCSYRLITSTSDKSAQFYHLLVQDYDLLSDHEDAIETRESMFGYKGSEWFQEKIASFTVGSAFFPDDLASPYALRMFPVLPVFHHLIGLECFGILSIVGFTTIGKRVPEARIFTRFLAIPVVLLGMVLSKAAQCYFKTCTMFSLASMYSESLNEHASMVPSSAEAVFAECKCIQGGSNGLSLCLEVRKSSSQRASAFNLTIIIDWSSCLRNLVAALVSFGQLWTPNCLREEM
ncbi:unnamed protein product [Arabidopsis halleri]